MKSQNFSIKFNFNFYFETYNLTWFFLSCSYFSWWMILITQCLMWLLKNARHCRSQTPWKLTWKSFSLNVQNWKKFALSKIEKVCPVQNWKKFGLSKIEKSLPCPKLNKICLVNEPLFLFENVANSPGFYE